MNDDLTVSKRLFVNDDSVFSGGMNVLNGLTVADHSTIAGFSLSGDTISAVGSDMADLKLTTGNQDRSVHVLRTLKVLNSHNVEVLSGKITTKDITVTDTVTLPSGSISADAIAGIGDLTPNFAEAVVMQNDLTVNKRLFVNDNITMMGKFIRQF